jgi:hypothetical protein
VAILVVEPTTTVATAEADVPAEEETLPEAEERPVTVEEETLPETEERPAQEPEPEPAAPSNIQVPTWNLDERIPIAPQVLDADTPQIGVGAADDDVEIVNLEDSELRRLRTNPHGCPRRRRGQSDGRGRHLGRRRAG